MGLLPDAGAYEQSLSDNDRKYKKVGLRICILVLIMRSLVPYIRIARINNVLMTGCAVALGFWLSRSALPVTGLFLLIIAGCFAVSFGNIINDLHDVPSDRISHSKRPLPRNELSLREAGIFAFFCAFVAMESAFFVSMTCAAATLVPLILLFFYTRFLKKVPLAGNIVVSLLVGYSIIFGALGAPGLKILVIPGVLAFLLNLAREIIKDFQDEPGDRAAGIATTASLPVSMTRAVVYSAGGACFLLLFLPWQLRHFGNVYAGVCAAVVLPVQIIWFAVFSKKEWQRKLSLISLLLKIEMAAGLAALAADRLFSP
jgi:geranylgeranylglycerol-phosphate geranylgeranyltransferase